MPVKVNWYKNKVKVVIKGAMDEALLEFAHLVEGQTKINIRDNDQIDTGFMLNSTYVAAPDSSGYDGAKAAAESQATNRQGERVDHRGDMAPAVQAEPGVVALCVGAVYAIYQEARKSFLYAALQQIAPQFGGVVTLVKRKKGL